MSFLTILRKFFPLVSVLFFSYLSLEQKSMSTEYAAALIILPFSYCSL